MIDQQEWQSKRARIAHLLERTQLNGVLLTRTANFSWLSGGGQAHVGINSESAVASILCSRHGDFLLASAIEMPRMLAEECAGLPLTPHEFPWYTPAQRDAFIDAHCGVGRWGSDMAGATPALAADLTDLRIQLTASEQERLRRHAQATGQALEAAARMIRPGMTEIEVAGVMAAHAYAAGTTPVVTLVAADDRIDRFRHPIPTNQRIQQRAMVVICTRQHGLIVSATRLVAFGGLSDDLIRRAEACAVVDATAWHGSRPGRRLGEVFADIQAAYAAQGYPDEWHKHHQGGITGYENREVQARPDSQQLLAVGQAFAWNPSIAGTKSEDTMLLGTDGPESLTNTGNWPMITVTVAGQQYQRPGILVR